ncbi:PEP-CTERM sorting domain-containing protein [Leptothoe kymatousa]|uniref:PEP-CTERM sorting domain-containing protein n=1 Tax=Leptothoe kymatousa TAU-MAC 1615 TaxID=2364775 RepID=A0ABS5Y055_9CYAN|nr:PEP-CTERM sorting domain-containing protein [Leptothoe kymatousa]MBT9311222.1 PEP-CTERM sorting domain-containing protein [Leptothoe kymatousa TAU-MAC 1615]
MSRQSLISRASIAFGIGLSAGLINILPAQAFTYRFGAASTSSNATATGAAAKIEFDFEDVGNNQIQIDLQIKNTTGEDIFGDGATTSKLTGVAFDMFEGFDLVSHSLGNQLDTLLTEVAFKPFSNSLGDFDFALADNKNFEGGNANEALAEGLTDSISLVYSGLNGESIDAFRNRFETAFDSEELKIAARFQQVDENASDKLLGGEVEVQEVPEPHNLLGLGLMTTGLLLLGKRKFQPMPKAVIAMHSAG